VISVLISYCKDRARQKGGVRAPSLRTIEKEAYAWAERGIDTMEEAAAYIHQQNLRRSRLGRLMEILQIRGRNLTPAEDRFATSWLEMGFNTEVIALAYERTCLNTGGLNWNYLNKILTRWNESGFKTLEDIRAGDRKGTDKTAPRQLDDDDRAAIARLMQEV
jgi:DnaD/phage-associated family protein